MVVGFCGEVLTDRLRIPPLLVAVCGIVPLLPGLTIYQGLFAIVVDADKSKEIQIVLNGKTTPTGQMPAWKQLSDTDLAAVISYTKNNWSNKTGQVVQPSLSALQLSGSNFTVQIDGEAPEAVAADYLRARGLLPRAVAR